MEDTLNNDCCDELTSGLLQISSNYSPDELNLLRLYSIQTLKYPLLLWNIIRKSTGISIRINMVAMGVFLLYS